jgi:hypothetical protein
VVRNGVGSLDVGRADIELRLLSVVADQEGAAVFETAIEMDDGDATATLLGGDAVGGLEDDAFDGCH